MANGSNERQPGPGTRAVGKRVVSTSLAGCGSWLFRHLIPMKSRRRAGSELESNSQVRPDREAVRVGGGRRTSAGGGGCGLGESKVWRRSSRRSASEQDRLGELETPLGLGSRSAASNMSWRYVDGFWRQLLSSLERDVAGAVIVAPIPVSTWCAPSFPPS